MKSTFLLTTALMTGIGAVTSAPVSAETPYCTNDSLHGKFAFSAQGTTLPALGLPAPLTGIFASSGTAEFDGNGNFTLVATNSFAGILQGPATVTGTYAVNSDCSYTSKAANGVTFRAVIVNHGQQILILQTTPGVVITGTAEAQQSGQMERQKIPEREFRACNNASFAGSYGFLADGYAGAPAIPGATFAPLAGVGTVNVDRNGTFTMMAQRSVNGVLDPTPLPLSGSYTFSSACTVELSFDIGLHFNAVLVNNDEALFIETDPGTALIVRSKRI